MKKSTVGFVGTIIGFIAGSIVTSYTIGKQKNSIITGKEVKIDKFKNYYNILNQWIMLKNEGKLLETYFLNNNYKIIAIYGMGEIGNRLYEELKNSSIEVKYAIDQNLGSTFSELKVYDMKDNLEAVDAIVVTAVFAFDEIEKDLLEVFNCPIISLEDVVFDI